MIREEEEVAFSWKDEYGTKIMMTVEDAESDGGYTVRFRWVEDDHAPIWREWHTDERPKYGEWDGEE